MKMEKALALLKEQIEKADSLRKPPPFDTDYQFWNKTTVKILEEATIDPDLIKIFKTPIPLRATIGPSDRMRYYIKTLEAKKRSLEIIISEQERFAGTGNPIIAEVKPLEAYRLHPEIEKVSWSLFEDGHFAQAVEEAFKRVISEVKMHMVRKNQDTYDGGDSLMGHAFGMDNRTPHIKFNSLSNPEERDEQRGIMFLFKGIVGIRNRKAHDNVILDSPDRAVEYLGLGSLLMRLLDLSPKFDNG